MYHVSFPGLGLNFTVNRVAFTVGDFSVYWYGIIIGFGFILALLFAVRSLKRYGIKPDDFFDCVLAGLICGIIGARCDFTEIVATPSLRSLSGLKSTVNTTLRRAVALVFSSSMLDITFFNSSLNMSKAIPPLRVASSIFVDIKIKLLLIFICSRQRRLIEHCFYVCNFGFEFFF